MKRTSAALVMSILACDHDLRHSSPEAPAKIDGGRRDAPLAAVAPGNPGTPVERRGATAEALAEVDPAVRVRALDMLQSSRRNEVEGLVDLLVRTLNDSVGQVREAAQRVLTSHIQYGASPALLTAVLRGGDAESRARVAWQLGNIAIEPVPIAASAADSTTEGALRAALEDPDDHVRLYSARALVLGGSSASRRALDILTRDMGRVDAVLGVRSAHVLWLILRDPVLVRAAYERGSRDGNQWTRVETISAILDMGPDARVFEGRLTEMRDDPSAEVRDRIEKALYALRRAKPVDH